MKILYKFVLFAILSFSIYATTFLMQPVPHEGNWYASGQKNMGEAVKGNVGALVRLFGGTGFIITGLLVFIFYGNKYTDLKEALRLEPPWYWSVYFTKWIFGFFAARFGVWLVFSI